MPALAESPANARFPAEWSLRVLLADPHSQLARIHGLWTAAAAAGARHLPPIGCLGPVQLKPILPDVHVYDVRQEPPRYSFRLIGTRVTEHMGMNLTGKPVEAIPSDALRTVVGEILNAVSTRCTTIHIKAPRAVALPNGSHRSLESLWMPLGDDGETVTRILAISLLGEPIL
jgi:hypothetical protein